MMKVCNAMTGLRGWSAASDAQQEGIGSGEQQLTTADDGEQQLTTADDAGMPLEAHKDAGTSKFIRSKAIPRMCLHSKCWCVFN
jgi:hypothetical protein